MQSLERPPFEGQGVIITDCHDDNARVRLEIRFKSLFGVTPSFIGVESGEDADLEAAGHLVDVLSSARLPSGYDSHPTVVLVNVARRGDEQRRRGWDNGTPFCYTHSFGNTILSAYEDRNLALARKLGLLGSVKLLDIPTINEWFVS